MIKAFSVLRSLRPQTKPRSKAPLKKGRENYLNVKAMGTCTYLRQARRRKETGCASLTRTTFSLSRKHHQSLIKPMYICHAVLLHSYYRRCAYLWPSTEAPGARSRFFRLVHSPSLRCRSFTVLFTSFPTYPLLPLRNRKIRSLYETCPWEERVVRRWIMEGQVAPRYPGSDAPNFGGGKDPAGGSGAGPGPGGGTAGASAGGVIGFESTFRANFGPGAVGLPGRSGGGAGASGGVGGMQQQQQQQQQQQSQQQSQQQPHQQQTEECPICFMHYHGVNVTTCCAKPLCTECYLQVGFELLCPGGHA